MNFSQKRILQAIVEGLIARTTDVSIKDNGDGSFTVELQFLPAANHEIIVMERDGEFIATDNGHTFAYAGEWLERELKEHPSLLKEGNIQFVEGRLECALENIIDLAILLDRLYIEWAIFTA